MNYNEAREEVITDLIIVYDTVIRIPVESIHEKDKEEETSSSLTIINTYWRDIQTIKIIKINCRT